MQNVDDSFGQGKYFWNESYDENRSVHMKESENSTFLENSTFSEGKSDYVFDHLEVRVSFIIAYSIVFFCCVFGNLMVILLVILNRRLKSTTSFFLAHLAFADLCIGIFCIFQNLGFYLITSWIFGDFFCKMNQFIHGLSCTASVFILVVISTERYLAIIHPIRCKQILTRNRLRVIITLVWTISSLYSMPRYIISHTISNPLSESFEIICIMSRMRYNSKLFDVINFILLYLIPLGIMSILYSLIAVRLWHSNLDYPPSNRCRMENDLEETSLKNSASFGSDKRDFTVPSHRRSFYHSKSQIITHGSHYPSNGIPSNLKTSYRSSKNILRARRRAIRMLTIIMLAFAMCNLPFHGRKMWQYWSKNYDGASTFSALFTPITFLCTYSNSAINPVLYAFLSKNFQKSMKEFLSCNWREKSSKHLSMRQKSCRSVSRVGSVSKTR